MKTMCLVAAAGALGFVAAVAVAAPPVNDNMANATLVGEGTYQFTTLEATLDGPNYICESGGVSLGKDIWYKVRTIGAGTVTVSTCGSSFDTAVAIYLGETTSNRIACNDQRPFGTCAGANQSYVQFEAAAGATYLINVGGFSNGGGSGQLQVSGPIVGPTSYTYQGYLASGGAAFTGTADMSFKHFDAGTAGTQIGATQIRGAVPVVNGVFSVILEFDAPTGLATTLFLEPTVNGVALTRQPLTSSPLAVQASQALHVPWSGISGVPASVSGAFSPWVKSGNDIVYSAGEVGVGTTPLFPLHVATTSVYTVAQLDSSHAAGTWLNLNNTSTGGTYWHLISSGSGNGEGAGKLLIGASGSATTSGTVMTIQSNGNVGIGTSTPAQRLTVNGNVLANNIGVPSSIRFKDHVVPLKDALESLMKLEGVRFDWKPEYAKERGFVSDIGFVAEDVEKVFPEIVLKDADGNVIGMDYSRVTAVAVEAIKQLKVEQGKEIEKLRVEKDREIGELRERLERLERLERGK
ncbi:MAG: tail fiber domain-containing protein [Phycisphaerales bacterium]